MAEASKKQLKRKKHYYEMVVGQIDRRKHVVLVNLSSGIANKIKQATSLDHLPFQKPMKRSSTE